MVLADKGPVLILAICSNGKVMEPGTRQYNKDDSIRPCLPTSSLTRLFKARDTVRKLITSSDTVVRDGEPVRLHLFMKGLVDGPDFQLYGLNHGGAYLPAAQRYNGTFYQPLGDGRLELLTNTRHQVLIVSGLYGLLVPQEPIQLYSCHVPDDQQIAVTWTTAGLLTDVLLDYMTQNGIQRVLDFSADANYRNLIDWRRVRQTPGVRVLHAVSTVFRGPRQLPSFGEAVRTLLPEAPSTLLSLTTGSRIPVSQDVVTFQDSVMTAPPAPTNQAAAHPSTNRSDMVGRMRWNITTILNSIYGPEPKSTKNSRFDPRGFYNRITNLIPRGLDARIAQRMQRFARLRNPEEYGGDIANEETFNISDEVWLAMINDYQHILNWASTYLDVRRLRVVDFNAENDT